MSSNNNNQNVPAVSWRFKGTQGAMPWKESFVESTLAAEIASALVLPAGGTAAAPASAAPDAQLTQATATAADAVQWNLEALQSRGQSGVLGELVGTEVASQTLASVESMRPYAYGLAMDAAHDATLSEHTKPTEWSAAEASMESTRPYTTDSDALAIFESAKPMLLADVTDGAGTTKPLEWSPSMTSALEQPFALALEGSAQQLLQAMAGFAPSAMGTSAAISATQATFNQDIAVGLKA